MACSSCSRLDSSGSGATRPAAADPAAITGIHVADSNAVTCMAFSPDGRTVAAGFASGELICWDAETHAQIERLGRALPDGNRFNAEGAFGVRALVFSPDSTLLISTGVFAGEAGVEESSGVQVWQWRARQLTQSIEIKEPIWPSAMAVSADGELVAVALETAHPELRMIHHSLREWNLRTGKPTGELIANDATRPTLPVARLLYGRDNSEILTADRSGQIRSVNLRAKQEAAVASMAGEICDMIAMDNAAVLFASDDCAQVARLERAAGQCKRTSLKGGLLESGRLALIGDGGISRGTLLGWGGTTSHAVNRWSVSTGDALLRNDDYRPINGQLSTISAARCIGQLRGGKLRGWAADMAEPRRIRIWDLETMKELAAPAMLIK